MSLLTLVVQIFYMRCVSDAQVEDGERVAIWNRGGEVNFVMGPRYVAMIRRL